MVTILGTYNHSHRLLGTCNRLEANLSKLAGVALPAVVTVGYSAVGVPLKLIIKINAKPLVAVCTVAVLAGHVGAVIYKS
jgi:hypothetical protein